MNQNCNKIEIKYSLLKEYLEGESSQEKKEQIASWFENPDLRFKFEYCLKELLKETDPDKITSPTGLNVILDRIHHKINLLQPKKAPSTRPGQNIPVIKLNAILKNLARVAAILLVPLITYLGWEVFNQRMWEKSQAEVVYNEFFCPLGVRSHFELPDGTSGWLNNGSRLKYPAKFLSNQREVELTGEAYFDVSHKRGRPFIINTDGLDVKVLGTRLNVYAYPNEATQSFTLEEGSIELFRRDNGEEITVLKMEPGQHAVYALTDSQPATTSGNQSINKQQTIFVGKQARNEIPKDKNPITHENINVPEGKVNIRFEETFRFTDWKDGKLVLRDDPMPLMLKRIERWYNVRFNVTDERINNYRYWATFEEENLDQVLEMLSLTGPIMFEKRSREQLDDGTFSVQEIDIKIKN